MPRHILNLPSRQRGLTNSDATISDWNLLIPPDGKAALPQAIKGQAVQQFIVPDAA